MPMGNCSSFMTCLACNPKFTPRWHASMAMRTDHHDGLKQYVQDVTTRDFPQRENWFTMSDGGRLQS